MITFGDILVYVVTVFGLYTAIFFVLTLFQSGHTIKRPLTKWRPKVAVIVPCYNEEDTVSKTVESLLGLNYPKNKLEIIVVDDGSTDNTYAIASKYKKQGVKVFRKKNGGKYTALNLGISKTNAELIGILDADSIVDSEALIRMLPFFIDKDVMAVTPSMKIHNPKNWLQKIQMMEYLIGIFLRKVFAMLGSIHVCPGPFSFYKAEFFKEHGLFRHAYNVEDIEMALRIQSLHFQIENAVDAYVYTIGPDTFKTLYKQRIRWYHGFVENVLDYRNLFSKEHGNLGLFVLPASFASVFLVIITMFYMTFKILEMLWNKWILLKAIDFDWKQLIELKFDTFFLTFNEVAILSILTISLSIALIMLAKSISAEKTKIRYTYVIYVLTYWVLFGFWWLVSFGYKLLGKKTKWGHRSSS